MYSKVGTHSFIERSTIGKKCVIGKNVKITNCYIWNKVEIQDGCELADSIICDNVVIKRGSKISSGSIISFGVHVKEGVIIPPAT
jgi:translation initiation factor eIF-2B subunit epsilon